MEPTNQLVMRAAEYDEGGSPWQSQLWRIIQADDLSLVPGAAGDGTDPSDIFLQSFQWKIQSAWDPETGFVTRDGREEGPNNTWAAVPDLFLTVREDSWWSQWWRVTDVEST